MEGFILEPEGPTSFTGSDINFSALQSAGSLEYTATCGADFTAPLFSRRTISAHGPRHQPALEVSAWGRQRLSNPVITTRQLGVLALLKELGYTCIKGLRY